jgi:hypothetical protein
MRAIPGGRPTGRDACNRGRCTESERRCAIRSQRSRQAVSGWWVTGDRGRGWSELFGIRIGIMLGPFSGIRVTWAWAWLGRGRWGRWGWIRWPCTAFRTASCTAFRTLVTRTRPSAINRGSGRWERPRMSAACPLPRECDFGWLLQLSHARSRELRGFQLARHASPCPLARVARPDAHRALPLRAEHGAGPFTIHDWAAGGRSGPPFRIGLLASSSCEIDLANTGLFGVRTVD